MLRIGWLVAVILCAAAYAQAKRPVIVVAGDGSGQFRTVQEAVDAAQASTGAGVRIEIKPGIYRQVLTIKAKGVALRGMGVRPEDVVLVYANSAKDAGGTSKSASTTVTGDDFRAENLTFANDFEKTHGRVEEGSQAVALLVTGDREVFRRVRFLGYQDTLYANSKTCHAIGETGPCRASRQYYSDCYIEGHVDFIFGDAKAVFDRCKIHAMAHSVVTITAQSRVRPEEDSGYVFRDCTVTAEAGAKDILLGRPWRAYSTVIWIGTDFKAPVDAKGWAEWDGRLATSDYEEYGSKGLPGDLKVRLGKHQPAEEDQSRYATKSWLAGADGWNPQV
jgi:pectinesterase